jgi:RNA polymerase sigma-70 factor (ECF subfamily)
MTGKGVLAEPLDVSAERARLVRLCAALTCPEAAEDLAHETLLEAHRAVHRLRDPARRPAWLAGIARNVCRRWLRRTGWAARRAQPRRDEPTAPDERLADDDVTLELDRRELAALLDRAMALLPPATRAALVLRYVEDLSPGTIAARLALTEGAVAMRLQRGKLALRRLLAGPLADDAAAYGFLAPEHSAWRETRIWCTVCGERSLLGRFTPEGELWLDCVGCLGLPRSTFSRGGSPGLFRGATGYRAAFERQVADADGFFREHTARGIAPCSGCGRPARLRVSPPADALPLPYRYVQTCCPRCGPREAAAVGFLALADPAGRRFWRAHPRVRMLPEWEVEAGGVAALVSTYESVVDAARLEVVRARDGLTLLAVGGRGLPPDPGSRPARR